ncbi:MAG: DUF167 domain-containing protein [Candidatus Omnitrophota bacterium]|nr:DUF167 domain-containing protein [Candidatus Omnitrophota bacterium]MDD5137432.1 DUF167 domain-containing protein [Candidatus Omnitrophota bacterium]MDD5538795.1 DUF167 domain-containing protein [Candidatus Omnitrophota bacterium]
MILEVKVIPKSSRNKVVQEAGRLKVYVSVAPEKGKANKALVELIAEHFCVRKSDVRIRQGLHTHTKIVEIPG